MKIFVTLVPILAASSATAGQPVAEHGEPPILESKGEAPGDRIFKQTFTADEQQLSLDHLTVADMYSMFGANGGSIAAHTVRMRCRLGADGQVTPYTCSPSESEEPNILAVIRVPKFEERLVGLPAFRPLGEQSGDKWEFYRFVEFDLAVPEVSSGPIDLTSGPLVDHKQFLDYITDEYKHLSYPARALRRGLSGVQTLECQIQMDTSVICRSIDFTVPEAHGIFAAATKRFFRNARISSKLDDGSDQRGARFRVPIRWSLPS
ncbi:energy transducer TonB [Qipengyuania gelatinilytica]|uniref:Energy transducer TonB n=1 Tax=Qipengyuania gelatinilytica TaxID=2867231 RepID=A0ABX9A2K2_9SPHN|nr:energy transducer TonB [Qipengyuania gelatinilytica]QZD95468.1 energy transducer TonB [Qipengyuania gelatinilytica]